MKKHDQILCIMSLKSPVERSEIREKTGIDNANMGTYLQRLIKEEYIEKIGYGEYNITEKGKKRAEFIQKKYEGQSELLDKEKLFENTKTVNRELLSDFISDTKTVQQIAIKHRNNKEALEIFRNFFN